MSKAFGPVDVAPVVRPTPANLRLAVRILDEDGLVIFPTDTVYGVGGRASSTRALTRLYAAKGRPRDKPLQLILPDTSWIERLADEVSPLIARLAEAFLPGPLTLVVRKGPSAPADVGAEDGTVALRVPDHPTCLALTQLLGEPLAATSANRSGYPSPRTAAQAVSELGDMVDLVLDDGPAPLGVESTILDVAHGPPRLLRVAALTAGQLEAVAGPLGGTETGPSVSAVTG